MRLLQTAPLALLELVIAAIQAIEARPGARLLSRQSSPGNTTLAAPIIVEPSQHWEGVDGIWSTFAIRVGTPSSIFRVLPATSWQETWVVYGSAAGVCNATAGVTTDCQDDRGGVFDVTKSSSWVAEKQRPLDLNADLGYAGVGQYGYDTVGLGFTNTSGPALQKQVVSAIVSREYWFGSLGLGFQPTNWTNFDDPQPSFADSLFTQGKISSRSWSYTAGAYYRLKSVFGSLIFGGYDAAKFAENNITFTMAGDNLRDLIVTMRGISVGGKPLLETPEFAFIDSAVAELWLPVAVCEAFEKEFGLQLDEKSGYYLLNSTTHADLIERKPEFRFTLSNQKDSNANETLDIVLPYAAFDFNISAPLLPNRTEHYFPIRRANEGRYVLGRTFLQEAYITAHYGDRAFNVSQCVFEDGTGSQIIALPEKLQSSPLTPILTPAASNKKLSTGAIVGIVIAVLAVLFMVAAWLIIRRRKKSRRDDTRNQAVEIDPGKRIEKFDAGGSKWTSEHGGQASSFTNEVQGRERVEIDGAPIMRPVELAGDTPLTMTAREKEEGMITTGALKPLETKQAAEDGALEKEYGRHNATSPISPTSPASFTDKELEEGVDLVSPITDTNKRSRLAKKSNPNIRIQTPTPTSPLGRDEDWKGWIPTSPVQRSGTAGSRFRESL